MTLEHLAKQTALTKEQLEKSADSISKILGITHRPSELWGSVPEGLVLTSPFPQRHDPAHQKLWWFSDLSQFLQQVEQKLVEAAPTTEAKSNGKSKKG